MGSRPNRGAPVRVWRYVIRNNDGSAPNYDPPFHHARDLQAQDPERRETR